MYSSLLLFLVIYCIHICIFLSEHVEEFHAHGPMDFHNNAMNAFMEARKINPKENLSTDSPFLQRASQHAIKRLMRKPDDEFNLRVSDGLLNLLFIIIGSFAIYVYHMYVSSL